MRSSVEAVEYAKALHALVVWLDICDGNMQEGSFRCDANVSVRRPGAPFGTRREIKNLNSFRFMQQAIDYEVQWQIDLLEDGGRVQQATVLFDPEHGETRAMRSKEDAHDYRYFPDPDLPPLAISEAWIAEVRATMPELPREMAARFQRDYGLAEYDARIVDPEQGVRRLLRERGAGERPAEAGRQLDDGRDLAAHERGGAELDSRCRRRSSPRWSGGSPTARSPTTPRARCSTRSGKAKAATSTRSSRRGACARCATPASSSGSSRR